MKIKFGFHSFEFVCDYQKLSYSSLNSKKKGFNVGYIYNVILHLLNSLIVIRNTFLVNGHGFAQALFLFYVYEEKNVLESMILFTQVCISKQIYLLPPEAYLYFLYWIVLHPLWLQTVLHFTLL